MLDADKAKENVKWAEHGNILNVKIVEKMVCLVPVIVVHMYVNASK